MNNSAIFIHSLYRAGSTYMFNVFRRSDQSYWCYQEPENEMLIKLNEDADKLLLVGEEATRSNRHPALNRPYFWEFHQIRSEISGLFHKSFSFDEFFIDAQSDLSEDQIRYFSALISHAKGHPVLQLCRSAGRIGAIKKSFGGTHIHLWREPRNQWWSLKVNDYFDSAIQLIYNAKALPPVLAETKRSCGIIEYHSHCIDKELEHAGKHPLSVFNNYFAFFALWVYAFFECEIYSDVTISIDKLSVDKSYRESIKRNLTRFGVDGIDFSDCHIPQTVFTEEEDQFLRNIEHKVIGLFLLHGYSKATLDKIDELHRALMSSNEGKHTNFLRDAERARGVALRYMDQYAKTGARTSDIEKRASEAEKQAVQAEGRASDAQSRAIVAETRSAEAESRAIEAEARATVAEARATEAETYASDADIRLNQAETSISEAEAQIYDLLHSTSWRITAPLRWLSTLFRKILGGITSFPIPLRAAIRTSLSRAAFFVRAHPRLRRILHAILNRFPMLKQRLVSFIIGGEVRENISINIPHNMVSDVTNLTPRARRIFTELKNMMEVTREEG